MLGFFLQISVIFFSFNVFYIYRDTEEQMGIVLITIPDFLSENRTKNSFIKTVAISNKLSYNENTKGEQVFVCTMLQLNNPLKRN